MKRKIKVEFWKNKIKLLKKIKIDNWETKRNKKKDFWKSKTDLKKIQKNVFEEQWKDCWIVKNYSKRTQRDFKELEKDIYKTKEFKKQRLEKQIKTQTLKNKKFLVAKKRLIEKMTSSSRKSWKKLYEGAKEILLQLGKKKNKRF